MIHIQSVSSSRFAPPSTSDQNTSMMSPVTRYAPSIDVGYNYAGFVLTGFEFFIKILFEINWLALEIERILPKSTHIVRKHEQVYLPLLGSTPPGSCLE